MLILAKQLFWSLLQQLLRLEFFKINIYICGTNMRKLSKSDKTIALMVGP